MTKGKISIIGAGSVGSTLAMRVVESGLADVVLLDVAKEMTSGKALDIADASPLVGHERSIIGTDDYAEISSSDVVVITAVFARKPGMTRENLIARNAGIVKDVSGKIKAHAPASILMVVTNPLDSMTYLAYKTCGFKRERVFGMAGVLDGGRFIQLIAEELKVPRSSVKALMLGSHGDTMVPVLSQTTVAGKPLEKSLSKDKIDAIIKRTRERGAEIVSLLGTGSAYYSPSAAAFKMIEAVMKDSKEVMPASAILEGEYELSDIAIGVPARIGRRGIEEIVELKLTAEEKEALSRSAQTIKAAIKLL